MMDSVIHLYSLLYVQTVIILKVLVGSHMDTNLSTQLGSQNDYGFALQFNSPQFSPTAVILHEIFNDIKRKRGTP